MNRRESVKFCMSVEGENCEKLYFEHLARIINNSGRNKYNLKIDPKKMEPDAFAKRYKHLPRGVYIPKGKKKERELPFIHIQDIEDYYNQEQLHKFQKMIAKLREAESNSNLRYLLGYSNYTFELWVLLHVTDFTSPVSDRTSYLNPINKYFSRSFVSLNEFKKESEFQKILDEYITLDSVFQAIQRAKRIVEHNKEQGNVCEEYKRFKFYHDNPDTTVHDVVQLVFEVCGVK